jgi:hypothetical protein
MSYPSRPTKRPRRPCLETLESRELLSVIGAPAHSSAEVSILAKKPPKVQTIKGSLNGQAMVTSGNDLSGHESLTGTGSATPVGAISFSGHVNYLFKVTGSVHTVTYSKGGGSINAPGGQLFVSFSGSGKHTGPSKFSLLLHGTVTGGTGQYAHATGSFTGQGNIDDRAQTFSLSFTLKVTTH